MKAQARDGEPHGNEFDNFDRLFRAVVAVPKSAVEKEEAKERLKNRAQREMRKKAATKRKVSP